MSGCRRRRRRIFNIMKDWKDVKIKEQLRKRYNSYIPSLMKVAQKCGYALAVHGSMTRDLDLVAVPWTKKAMAPESLVISLEKSLVGYSFSRNDWKKVATQKPHGRKAYSIVFAHLADDFENPRLRHAYIDLSITSREIK